MPPARLQPFDVEALLDCHRNAEQRLVIARSGCIKRFCRIVCPLEIGHRQRVNFCI